MTARWGLVVGWALLALGAVPAAAGAAVDHSAWDALLHRYVSAEGLVDYAAAADERTVLDGYRRSLSSVDAAALPRSEQLAFWINAYNACVFTGVLDHYPLTSVKHVKGFFDKAPYPIGGESLTLNEIEAKGRALGDWRIHFAVVCASSSCPLLRNEAYAADRVEAQLTEQAMQFLADPRRGLRVEPQVLWLSKIFTWYASDFVPDGRIDTSSTIGAVVMAYLTPEQQLLLRQRHVRRVKFLDYDWALNERTTTGGER